MKCEKCGNEYEGDFCPNGCNAPVQPAATKFCKFCGGKIPEKAVVCTLCGCQVEELQSNQNQPNVIINNSNANTNIAAAVPAGTPKSKWTAVVLCALGLAGLAGFHKFYEGKIGMGIVYFLTGGLCAIGTIIDLVSLLGKPDPYYV